MFHVYSIVSQAKAGLNLIVREFFSSKIHSVNQKKKSVQLKEAFDPRLFKEELLQYLEARLSPEEGVEGSLFSSGFSFPELAEECRLDWSEEVSKFMDMRQGKQKVFTWAHDSGRSRQDREKDTVAQRNYDKMAATTLINVNALQTVNSDPTAPTGPLWGRSLQVRCRCASTLSPPGRKVLIYFLHLFTCSVLLHLLNSYVVLNPTNIKCTVQCRPFNQQRMTELDESFQWQDVSTAFIVINDKLPNIPPTTKALFEDNPALTKFLTNPNLTKESFREAMGGHPDACMCVIAGNHTTEVWQRHLRLGKISATDPNPLSRRRQCNVFLLSRHEPQHLVLISQRNNEQLAEAAKSTFISFYHRVLVMRSMWEEAGKPAGPTFPKQFSSKVLAMCGSNTSMRAVETELKLATQSADCFASFCNMYTGLINNTIPGISLRQNMAPLTPKEEQELVKKTWFERLGTLTDEDKLQVYATVLEGQLVSTVNAYLGKPSESVTLTSKTFQEYFSHLLTATRNKMVVRFCLVGISASLQAEKLNVKYDEPITKLLCPFDKIVEKLGYDPSTSPPASLREALCNNPNLAQNYPASIAKIPPVDDNRGTGWTNITLLYYKDCLGLPVDIKTMLHTGVSEDLFRSHAAVPFKTYGENK